MSAPITAGPTAGDARTGFAAEVVVDLDAVAANVGVLRQHAGDAAVMAVVKADAYGHGLLPCALAALAGGAAWLGVAQVAEALTLREAGIDAPVLCWLAAPGGDLADAVSAGTDVGVSAPWALAEAAAAGRTAGSPARVHLKIDTGLGRGGATPDDWDALVAAALAAQAEGAVHLVGVWSHFAWADAPDHPTVRAQEEVFADAVARAERRGARFEVRHLANSAATLTNPGAALDMVRPGIAVYGLSPVPDIASAGDLGLTPAMTLTARLALVKRVGAGQGVSYGHAYTTPVVTTLAVVPLGYADGVPRHAGNAGPVLAAGRGHRVAGRVCMDQFVLDLGDDDAAAAARAGDEVVLFGSGAGGGPTAQGWAEAAGTISYEIVSRVGARVPRRYVGTAGVA